MQSVLSPTTVSIAMPLRRIISLLAAAFVTGTLLAAAPATGTINADHEEQFRALINSERSANGLGSLASYWDLQDDARAHSGLQMATNHLHHNPNLGSVTTGWYALGENVGVGPTVQSLHDAFMASSGHRANILGDFNYVGIGVAVESPTKMWVTVVFMRGPEGLAEPSGPAAKITLPEGATNLGVVDTSSGIWYLRDNAGAITDFYYGNAGDSPAMGDWDCDGVDTPGLYRRADGYVYLRNSNTQGIADIRFYFGNPSDLPLVGDFNGDGCDTVSLYRPENGQVYIINKLGENEGGLGAADYHYALGNGVDQVYVADFDGDGTDQVHINFNSSRSVVVGDWDADGDNTVGAHAGDSFTLYKAEDGGDSDLVNFGNPGWTPVSGDFGF